MAVDGAFLQVWTTGLAGPVLAVAVGRFLRPRPVLLRPGDVWLLHAGLWGLVHAILVLLLGRPWCALAAETALMVTLTVVSNAKWRSLREPFIAQDYDYFLDALRFPRLFLPFLGMGNFCLAVSFFVLALLGLRAEVPPASRFAFHGQLGGALSLFLAAAVPLVRWRGKASPVVFDPETDLRTLGLLPSLWLYARASGVPPKAVSPFARASATRPSEHPHLIAIQSESFFDARGLSETIRPDVLRAFDALRAEADLHGPLIVPAWGANTVRTEFSFLTGIPARCMGVHRFNPYRAVLRGWETDALPGFLRRAGYRTVCLHPYQGSFYGRSAVLPRLGFDEFLDIDAFRGARRAGAYVADEEVGKRIVELLRTAEKPLFIFAVTMENHGPLRLDRMVSGGTERPYSNVQDKDRPELDAYLRHLGNADAMIGMLHSMLAASPSPVSFCFYGDHVPIMPTVYEDLGDPGDIPYVLWSNPRARELGCRTPCLRVAGGPPERQLVEDLALVWLARNGLVGNVPANG